MANGKANGGGQAQDYFSTLQNLIDTLNDASILLDAQLKKGGLSEADRSNAIASQTKIYTELIVLKNAKQAWLKGQRDGITPPSTSQVAKAMDLATKLGAETAATLKITAIVSAVVDAFSIANSILPAPAASVG
jgi:hypothetical protein